MIIVMTDVVSSKEDIYYCGFPNNLFFMAEQLLAGQVLLIIEVSRSLAV
jgi:hypothetical protein